MQSMFSAETAVFLHLESVGIVFLVLLCVIVALLALAARESDLNSHCSAPPVYSGPTR